MQCSLKLTKGDPGGLGYNGKENGNYRDSTGVL